GVDLRTLPFPDSVQGVVASRIDRLEPSLQLTLKVASVIGRVFAYRTLHDVYPLRDERTRLPDNLTTLERMNLTPQEVNGASSAYVFRHALLQETVYQSLLFAQRRQLHRFVADWYEQTHGAELGPFAAVLAYHWGRAGCDRKAVEYLEMAGDQS